MKSLFKPVSNLILLTGISLLVFSCSTDEKNSFIENQQVSSEEIKTVLATDEISSAADKVVTSLFQNGQSGKSSRLEDCYISEYTDTGFIVTFDNCSVEGGELLTGSLSVTYNEGSESTSFTSTYTDLSVGDYIINGTRIFSMSNSSSEENVSFTIVGDMTINHIDGSIIEEVGTKTFGVLIDTENFENSALTINGNWTLKVDGNTYSINITAPLEFIFGCEYAGKGVMELTKNGLNIDVDLGDGTCDDLAMATYPDGTTQEISLKD